MGPLEAERVTRELCTRHGWEFVEILRFHPRKQTVTARILVDGTQAVLKAPLPSASTEVRAGIQREAEFYRGGSFTLAPQLLCEGDGHYCRRYEPGMSLRQYFRQEPDTAKTRVADIARELVQALVAHRRRPSAIQDVDGAAAMAMGRFRNLMTSGPHDTRRGALAHGVARRVAAHIAPAIRVSLRRAVSRWHEANSHYASDFSHNDLHADNVLVTPEGPRVVDFENMTSPGFWWVDSAYFVASCFAMIPDLTTRNGLLGTVEEVIYEAEPDMAQDLARILQLFCGAAVSNSRFRGSSRVSPTDGRLLLRAPVEVLHLVLTRG